MCATRSGSTRAAISAPQQGSSLSDQATLPNAPLAPPAPARPENTRAGPMVRGMRWWGHRTQRRHTICTTARLILEQNQTRRPQADGKPTWPTAQTMLGWGRTGIQHCMQGTVTTRQQRAATVSAPCHPLISLRHRHPAYLSISDLNRATCRAAGRDSEEGKLDLHALPHPRRTRAFWGGVLHSVSSADQQLVYVLHRVLLRSFTGARWRANHAGCRRAEWHRNCWLVVAGLCGLPRPVRVGESVRR